MNPAARATLLKEIEAVLMVSSEPLSAERAERIFGVDSGEFQMAIDELAEFYSSSDRGFFVQKVAGGYRFASSPEMSPVIEKFALSQIQPRLSSAVLETLAIVAYRQPISRAQISSIRGVNSDYVIKVLISRGYIESSSRDAWPGSPHYYTTTPSFLEKLGIYSLTELPKVEGFMPPPEVADALEASLFDGSY